MNKLDLRDYLHHAYSVRTVSIRSYVEQQRVQQGKSNSVRPAIKRWFRPRAIKKMVVELESPFVWPEEPSDFEPWSKDTYEKAREDNEKYQRSRGRLADERYDVEDRRSLNEQAKALLAGQEKWRPGMSVGQGGRR